MTTTRRFNFLTLFLLCLSASLSLAGCTKDSGSGADTPEDGAYQIPNVPAATAIDGDFVGTWYPTITLDHPLTQNWENKTFVGSEGFEDYRTMVFTADGKNSIEYKTTIPVVLLYGFQFLFTHITLYY